MQKNAWSKTGGQYEKKVFSSIIDFGNGWVNGHIDVTEDGKVLFTSIPYDEGWEIKVNGEKAEAELYADAFITIPLQAGDNNIEMDYHAGGIKAGALLSAIGILLTVGAALVGRRKEKRLRK